MPVASVKTLQCGSDHSICIIFVATFLLCGNRPKIINDETDSRKYDDSEPCILVDI